jgi:deoxyribodipyrimidine photolyase-like uncharacterized protein
MVSIREFKGEPGELGFLEYIFQSARALSTVVVVMANPMFTPFLVDEAHLKAMTCYENMRSACNILVLGSKSPAGGEMWNFKEGADFATHDPFSVAEVR